MATDLFRQRSSADLLDRLAERARASLAAGFAAVLDTDEFRVVACEGDPPDHNRLNALARQALSPPPFATNDDDAGVATAYMVQADLVLVVGRRDPVLRDRERQWVSILAEIADHGWQDLA